MYIFTVYASCASAWPGLLSVGVARAFGTVGLACAMKCEKCEKEGKGSKMWAHFWTAQNTKIWSFLKMTMCFIYFARRCCSLSHTHRSRRKLHGVVAAFTLCLLFCFRTRLLALSSSLPTQFCHFEPHRTQRYGHFSRRPCALFASLGAANLSLILIVLDANFMALWLHLRSVFSSVFTPGS